MRWEVVAQGGGVVALARSRKRAEERAEVESGLLGRHCWAQPHRRTCRAFDGDGQPVEMVGRVPSSSLVTCEGCGTGPRGGLLLHIERWAVYHGGAGGDQWLCPPCLRVNHKTRGGTR